MSKPDYEALKKYCNLWRNWYDIQDSYQSLNTITEYFAINAPRIQPHAGPGHWNDPDMVTLHIFKKSISCDWIIFSLVDNRKLRLVSRSK